MTSATMGKPDYVLAAERASADAHARVAAFAAELETERAAQSTGSKQPLPVPHRARYSAASGAARTNGLQGWSPPKEEQIFEGFARDVSDLQARGFDLHVNSPDIRGHNHGRAARCVGKGVAFKCLPVAEEIGIAPEVTVKIARQIDRLRELHSDAGGFDAQNRMRSEGVLQYVAFLTHFIFGSCLIHRVWDTDRARLLPFGIELIPGSRISQPYEKMGDPLVHNGVAYADAYRSKVTGWYVRRVPKTIGNSSVALPEWDFIAVADAAMLELVEPAGVDRSFPNAVAAMRLVFNRGEMVELNVEAARKHATVHGVLEVKDGHNPEIRAEDMVPDEFTRRGGVMERVIWAGDKYTLQNSFLPGPDFPGFFVTTDGRLARALNTRLSEFTRTNQGSYSGGMQENQIDKPNVDVMRENFVDAWRGVHGWVLDACYLSGAVEMPKYSARTKAYWLNARVRFPGEQPLNPVDHENAKNMRIANGTSSEIGECEADGHDYQQIQRDRGQSYVIRREVEKELDLPEGTLDPKNDLPDVKESTSIDGDHDGKTDEKNRKKEKLPGYGAHGNVTRLVGYAATFEESKHPRDEDGEFTSGGGGGSSGSGESGESKGAAKKEKAVKGEMKGARREGAGKDARVVLSDGSAAPAHIKAGMVPPAWTDVKVGTDPHADVLVTGKDAKGRPKTVYADKFHMKNAANKFARTREGLLEREHLAHQNQENRNSSDPATREAADCTFLMQEQGTRPGSDSDTGGKVKAYGATTLRAEHVIENADGSVNLKFIGKEGVSHDHKIGNPELASMLVERAKTAGQRGGKLFDTNYDKVVSYAKTLDHGRFTPKDFRTIKANSMAVELVGKSAPKNMKEYKSAVMGVAKTVSAKLGNRPAQALESYIDPTVFSGWKAGLSA